eukprot:gene6-12814_t
MQMLQSGSGPRLGSVRQSHGQSSFRLPLPPLRANPEGKVDRGFSILELTGKLAPQGLLVTGASTGWRLAWQIMVKELAPQDKSGTYVRQSYSFTNKIGSAEFPVESGRYHLYMGNACPWCHRVMLAMVLRGLTSHISVTRLASDPSKARRGGWIFNPQSPDPLFNSQDLWQVYDTITPGWKGRCTAPLLVDKKTCKIVSNESADIGAQFCTL